MNDISRQAPYNDDFDPTKNYHQLLFRPDNAVQARELTTLQSIQAHQTSIHAKHTFKEGTPVIGGQMTIRRILYVKIDNDHGGFPVEVQEFVGKKVIELDSSDNPTGKEGTVLVAKNENNQKSLFLDIDVLWTDGNTLKIADEAVYASIQETGRCFYLGLDAGEFFAEGKFVNVPRQSIILEDFNDEPTGTAGLVFTEEVITPSEDPSLFDPARGTTNYGSPGADRYKISAQLVYIKAGEEIPSNFSPLYEIRDGNTKTETNTTIYSDLAKEFARRTNDESGSYTVNPFQIVLGDGVRHKIKSISTSGLVEVIDQSFTINEGDFIDLGGNDLYTGRYEVLSVDDETKNFVINFNPPANITEENLYYTLEKDFSVNVGKGKAYVFGYETVNVGSIDIGVRRARDVAEIQNYSVVPTLGNYLVVENMVGSLGLGQTLQSVNLYDTPGATGTLLGTAQVSYIRYHSGNKGSTDKYRIYLLKISLSGSNNLESVKSLGTGSGFMANVAANSIVGGKTVLSSIGSSNLIYPISREGVSTLQPSGSPTTSFIRLDTMTGAASGDSIIFSLGSGSNSTFYGPQGGNFAGSEAELNNYLFVNTDNQQILEVSNIQITNNGMTLNVTFTTAGGNVSALVPVSISNSTAKAKTFATGTSTALANAPSRIQLSHYDVYEITSITKGSVDVTDKFDLDTGQTDISYEYSSIVLKPGEVVPAAGDYTISYNYYAHSGSGYFSVDSYPGDYGSIPTYRMSSGRLINLSDVIDFRVVGSTGIIPVPNSPIALDFSVYLPRIDALVVYSNGSFGIVEGVPASNPISPKIPSDAMVLYYLDIPPYTHSGSDVNVRYVDNKRYTMKDIGVLDKRITRLEYYTSLSLLEMNTKNKPIYDESGLERFKNGILVDGFTGHGVGDVFSGDYKCAIDPIENYCRPKFRSDNIAFETKSVTKVLSNTLTSDEVGTVYFLPYTEEEVLFNDIATKFEYINPFLVTKFKGSIECNPPTDDWYDQTTLPAVQANLTGDLDNYTKMLPSKADGTSWGSWKTTWSGSTYYTQERVGTKSTGSWEVISQSLGDQVRDVNIIHNMRAIAITCTVKGLRPNRDHYVFFEEDNMKSRVVASPGFAPNSGGSFRTDSNGVGKFVLNIPGGVYRTGDRTITVTDDPQNIIDNASSYASTIFYSSGFSVSKQESIVSTRVPVVTTQTVTQSRRVNKPVYTSSGSTSGRGGGGGMHGYGSTTDPGGMGLGW